MLEGTLALLFVGLIGFWVVYDLSFQRRVKRLMYDETTTTTTESGSGEWIEDRSGSRTWVSGKRVVLGAANLTWDQKMGLLRRHQRLSIVLAVLVLADMSYSFALFRWDYLNLQAAWQIGGPTKTTIGRADTATHPHRLWSIRFGGSVEAAPLPSGHVVVRNRGSRNSSLYLIDAKGKIIWRYRPDDGFVASAVEVVAGLDGQGRAVVVAASGGQARRYRAFVIDGNTGQVEESEASSPPSGLASEIDLGSPGRVRQMQRDAGRYRAEMTNWNAPLFGFPESQVILLDLGP